MGWLITSLPNAEFIRRLRKGIAMITKNIDEITEADLRFLIEDKKLEKKTMEYKQVLPRKAREDVDNKDKIEFLCDVSSFANASGGDLIYGISQDRETGVPKELVGLEIENVDQEIQRLENMIRTGIQPRIPSIHTQPISLSNSKKAIIIIVPKSWIGPHRVPLNDKFYTFCTRSSNGKYSMDVSELRIAFNLSETLTERIRKFRENRLSNIIADETPVPLPEKAKIILHLIPINAFDPAQNFDAEKLSPHSQTLRLINHYKLDFRYNLDGIINYSPYSEHESYVQVFRNGIIEAAGCGSDPFIAQTEHGYLSQPNKINAEYFEKNLIESTKAYLSFLKSIEVGLPIFLFLTLLGVKGYSIETASGYYAQYKVSDRDNKIDRDILLLPEMIVENYSYPMEKVLRPCFDAIWNACGFPRSLNYKEDGTWQPS